MRDITLKSLTARCHIQQVSSKAIWKILSVLVVFVYQSIDNWKTI